MFSNVTSSPLLGPIPRPIQVYHSFDFAQYEDNATRIAMIQEGLSGVAVEYGSWTAGELIGGAFSPKS